MAEKKTGLKRQRHPMPRFVKEALEESGLMDEYKKRPAYQLNDYIGWINRAKLQQTKEQRLRQMLEELELGGVYMKMKHVPSKKSGN
jgi:predicted unusual protein kinase regulating ubiquinone biosynthesis (AarF/ABC1/UbiB family)